MRTEEVELVVGDEQDALQPGGRATVQMRKRVEREEQGGVQSQEKRSPGWSIAGWSEEAKRWQRQRRPTQGVYRRQVVPQGVNSVPALVAPSWWLGNTR